jgi:hypothetical protein
MFAKAMDFHLNRMVQDKPYKNIFTTVTHPGTVATDIGREWGCMNKCI